MRMRKKPNLIPRMEACGRVLVASPEELKGSWRESFGARSLYVELGCGKGRFTAETAKLLESGALLVAVERVPEAMVVAMERVCAAGLDNVRFIRSDAALLENIFAPGEVERIYINFCDPWPSKRHAKRRLTSPLFLDTYLAVLAPGGEIHFKTDGLPLFEYSLEQFAAKGFSIHEETRDLHAGGPVGVMTDYEAKFYAEGKPICRCVARKEPAE
ncbi:MAG: tRNA (guanosine(46)-N7)-methyltransferase TrmB [Oscillospiraceae bacterium]|nr:tRNA (guanosine(46)-N7)-methyltransferase TrmB [Oscillospiraceae bacterium]